MPLKLQRNSSWFGLGARGLATREREREKEQLEIYVALRGPPTRIASYFYWELNTLLFTPTEAPGEPKWMIDPIRLLGSLSIHQFTNSADVSRIPGIRNEVYGARVVAIMDWR